jgi:hemerythrin-like domain-containing protein
MRTTEILMSEHRVIEQVLACLDKIAEDAFEKGAIELESARDVLVFLRTFLDGCHHGKEEQRLFPAMERCGLPPHAGPTAVMRQEHEMGRGHVRKMGDAVAAFETGDRRAVDAFASEARGFTDLLREHIAKEDQILFPMADRMLPAAVQDELLAGFEHAEKHEMGEGTHEKFLELADRLAARWGVTKDEAQANARTCGCSHASATSAPRGTRIPL